MTTLAATPTLPERIDAVWIALVTPAGIAAIVVAVALSLILWQQQRPRAEKPNPLMESWERDGRKPGELRRAER